MSYLMRRGPFRGVFRLQDEMDRMLQSFLGHPATVEARRQGARVPAVDVSETGEEVIVRAELPGITKENLELEVMPESLSLKAQIAEAKGEQQGTYHSRERLWMSFARTLPLPAEVRPDGATAKLESGVLEVRLPKSERAKVPAPRKVAIE